VKLHVYNSESCGTHVPLPSPFVVAKVFSSVVSYREGGTESDHLEIEYGKCEVTS